MTETKPLLLPCSVDNLSSQRIEQHRQSWHQVEEYYRSLAELLGQLEPNSELTIYQELVKQLRASPLSDCFLAQQSHSMLMISTTTSQELYRDDFYVEVSSRMDSGGRHYFELRYRQMRKGHTVLNRRTCSSEEVLNSLTPMLIKLWQDTHDSFQEISRFAGLIIRMGKTASPLFSFPHFYVQQGDEQAIYQLDPVQQIAGTLSVRSAQMLRVIEQWAIFQQPALLENWQLLQSGQPLHPISPPSWGATVLEDEEDEELALADLVAEFAERIQNKSEPIVERVASLLQGLTLEDDHEENDIDDLLESDQAIIKNVARRLYDVVKNQLIEIPEYREMNPLDYPYLDLAFYDKAEAELNSQGFKLLGNYTMVNWKSQYSQPTFIRGLVKDDMIVASVWHFIIEQPLLGTRHTKVIEYDTQFSNNWVIQTTPQTDAGKIETPPEFMRLFVDPKLSPGEMLQIHQDRVSAYQRDHPEVTPRLVRTLQELFAYGQQEAKLKAAYRRKSLDGIYSNEEIRKMAPYPLDDPTIEEIREEMRKLVAQEGVDLEN